MLRLQHGLVMLTSALLLCPCFLTEVGVTGAFLQAELPLTVVLTTPAELLTAGTAQPIDLQGSQALTVSTVVLVDYVAVSSEVQSTSVESPPSSPN